MEHPVHPELLILNMLAVHLVTTKSSSEKRGAVQVTAVVTSDRK